MTLPSGADPITEKSETQRLCSQGADPRTEQQRKGSDPTTGTLKGETFFSALFPCLLPVLVGCAGLSSGSGSLVLLPCPGGFPSGLSFFWPRASCSTSFQATGSDPITGFFRNPFKYVAADHFVSSAIVLVSLFKDDDTILHGEMTKTCHQHFCRRLSLSVFLVLVFYLAIGTQLRPAGVHGCLEVALIETSVSETALSLFIRRLLSTSPL